jgi:hypothetical protein
MRITESALRRIIREELTVGALRAALDAARGQKSVEDAKAKAVAAAKKFGEKGAEAAIGMLPGGGTLWSFISGAKDIAEIITAAADSDPQVKKKNPLWDKLTIDPEKAAIIDDEVEARFIGDLGAAVGSLPDDAVLPDADTQLSNWLKKKYSGAHVAKDAAK